MRLIGRFGAALAHDAARDRIVLFGGRNFERAFDETWEWDGAAWSQRTPTIQPAARSHHGLAWDFARARVVLFGGDSGAFGTPTPRNDLWEWDGTNWNARPFVLGPSPRRGLAMAYDPIRTRMVVFGGTLPGDVLANDPHWEWDGAAWAQGPAGPAARSGTALAYDLNRGRMVLFGGQDTCTFASCSTFQDTWEFDGVAWALRANGGPPSRFAAAMTFDLSRGRTVLCGGLGNCAPACSTTFHDTWDWDGVAWTLRSNSAPSAADACIASDPTHQRVVLFGGLRAQSLPDASTDAFDGTNWTTPAPQAMPATTGMQAVAFDEARTEALCFGNGERRTIARPETWTWKAQHWELRSPAISPPARELHRLTYDAVRQRVLLFGGQSLGGATLGDTWEWDGVAWLQRQPIHAPPAQHSHALTFDRGRAVIVLTPGTAAQNTMFEFDGTDWRARPVAVMPPSRLGGALAYDERRARTVLFGGVNTAYLDDTWEWDGTAWFARTPLHRPAPRAGAGLGYDAVRARIVLFGGDASTELWEWDGTDWSQRVTTAPPSGRHSAGFVWDSAQHRFLMFGGYGAFGVGGLHDTWELLVPCDRAGPGEVSGAGLTLDCTSTPRLGSTFCVRYANPAAAAVGIQALLVAAGACSTAPAPIAPPIGCAPSLLYVPSATTLLSFTNPAQFCFSLPPVPAFVGTPLCMQGASLENPGCLRATDGLQVIVQ